MVLDVIPEDVQIEHISSDMEEVAVHEHGGEESMQPQPMYDEEGDGTILHEIMGVEPPGALP